ncbi:hypothetical protein ACQ4PT_060914 [Festuca glaucescens]
MDAYLLLSRAAWMAPKIAYEEQDDDIGSASDSEATSRSSAASYSSDLADDASSSSSSSSAADLFEMSALMTQLPIKRGLSRFFDCKSQSFALLAAVGSLEDLAKPARKRSASSSSTSDHDSVRAIRLKKGQLFVSNSLLCVYFSICSRYAANLL